MAATSAGDRGYLMYLYVSGDNPSLAAIYTREYFKDVLATMQLRPLLKRSTPIWDWFTTMLLELRITPAEDWHSSS